MEKYKKLNEDVLDDESHPELIDLMRDIASDLKDIMNKFRMIAKAKGIRYEIAGAKNDEIQSKIALSTSNAGTKSLKGNTLDQSNMNVTISLQNLDRQSSADQSVRTIDSRSQKTKRDPSHESGIDIQEQIPEGEENGMDGEENKRSLSHDPDQFSDDDEDPRARELNKQALLEWVTVADFTKEVQLHKLANHKFKLDDDEINAMIGTEGILKICKTMMYKIGLTYKRMDIYIKELREEFKKDTGLTLGGLRKDLDLVNEVI